ncbi:hypothetical protein FRC04_002194 [Tulasnella sp. 424]|nr:hypothetical protein FRC04_002194 [Tulasnella sp. 424]KAG8967741.1 hypothetical protein FRC05_001920 [Tulasnella sp. 425]
MKSRLSQEKINKLLQLNLTQPSFQNKYEFFKKIDALPKGPRFACETVKIVGDILDAHGKRMVEEAELWLWDPVKVVRDLLGRTSLCEATTYAPVKACPGRDQLIRIYDKMWTGDWWYETQAKLPSRATIASVILASDKTQLSTFGGDKTAYPVYLTLRNFTKALKNYKVFHTCMARLLQPLVVAGKHGVPMLCGDGHKQLVFPLLATYCADYLEQCVVACCPENRCAKSTIGRDECGGLKTCWAQDQGSTLDSLWSLGAAKTQAEWREVLDQLKVNSVRAVVEPFWKDLPHCDIFSSLMPNILHQLHKGVFHAHLVAWCDHLMAPGELDHRFMSMASHPDLHHFSKGITAIKQWTGKEQRAMEKVFVGAVAGSVNDEQAMIAARAMVDFIYLAQLPAHTSETLTQLDNCLCDFHHNKSIFVETGIRAHFNIPKLHALVHYPNAILSCGAVDGYPEWFHIEYAKLGYCTSNKRDYQKQMVTWLEQQEAVDFFDTYIHWAQGLSPTAMRDTEGVDQGGEAGDLEEDEDMVVDSAPTLTPFYCRMTFWIAKRPPISGVSVLNIRNHFGVLDLVQSLTNYLSQLATVHLHLGIRTKVSTYETFNIFKRIVLLVPSVSHGFTGPWEDQVQATPCQVPHLLPNLWYKRLFQHNSG